MRTSLVVKLGLIALMLLGCSNGPGRYQMVVTAPFEGDSHYWNSKIHVIDTHTGVVYVNEKNGKINGVTRRDPINNKISWKKYERDTVLTDFTN